MINDVLQIGRRKGDEFIHAFAIILPIVIPHILRHSTNDATQKVKRVLDIWAERLIYSKEFLDLLYVDESNNDYYSLKLMNS